MSAPAITRLERVGRWAPGAQTRLVDAALQLFTEKGFEQTTVADIAERAGVTERTFFRHFPDKREVLFQGATELHDFVVDAIAAAPAELSPVDVVAAAYENVGALMDREFATRRAAAIAANPSLLERELLKLASLATASAEALRARGVDEPIATLAGEVGGSLFKVAFGRWITGAPERDLGHHVREARAQLTQVSAALDGRVHVPY